MVQLTAAELILRTGGGMPREILSCGIPISLGSLGRGLMNMMMAVHLSILTPQPLLFANQEPNFLFDQSIDPLIWNLLFFSLVLCKWTSVVRLLLNKRRRRKTMQRKTNDYIYF
jgi:hypothetical protein